MVCYDGCHCPYKLSDRVSYDGRDATVTRCLVLGKCSCVMIEICFDDNGKKQIIMARDYNLLSNI